MRTYITVLGSSTLDELDKLLWSFRTTPREATGETPYSLVYGTEAVLPKEIDLPTFCRDMEPADNDEARALELDLLEERYLHA